MRLIHRVIIILSAAALAMLVGNALILHLLVGEEFRNLENELAVRNANRAADAVSNNLAHLRSSAMDWATWDSSYAFMRGENAQDFIEQNLMFQSFQGIQVNLMYFLRSDGTVVWGGIHDLETGEPMDLPEFPADRLPPDRFALFDQEEDEPERSGILMTRNGPMLVASVPVHRADGTGSACGHSGPGAVPRQRADRQAWPAGPCPLHPGPDRPAPVPGEGAGTGRRDRHR